MDWNKLGEVTDWSDLDKVMTGKETSKKNDREMKDKQESNKESSGDSSKNPNLDEDVGDWSDMKQFDDDHDPDWFEEEEKRLAAKYGGNFIKVKYLDHSRPGYFCEICLVEMNAKKSLESHCEGMKHLKKKSLYEKAKIGEHHEENDSPEKGGWKDNDKQRSSDKRRVRSPESQHDQSGRNGQDRRGRYNERSDNRSRDRREESPHGQRNDRRDHPYRRHGNDRGNFRQSRDPYNGPEPQINRNGPPMDNYREPGRREMPVDHYGRSDRTPMDRYEWDSHNRPSQFNDRHGPPMNRDGNPMDRHGPPMDRHGPPMDRYGPPMDRYGPPVDRHSPSMDRYGPPVDRRGPPVDHHRPSMDRHGPPMDRHGPPMDRHGPPMDRHGPPMDRHGPPMDRHGPPMDRSGPPANHMGSSDRYERANRNGSTIPYNSSDLTQNRREPVSASPVLPKEKLNGGTTGVLLSKLSACYIKDEDDAELALNVISSLCSSLREYNTDKGEKKIAELLMEAELKMNTLKALKVGLKLLKNPSHILAAANASPVPTQQSHSLAPENHRQSQGDWHQSYPYNGPASSYGSHPGHPNQRY